MYLSQRKRESHLKDEGFLQEKKQGRNGQFSQGRIICASPEPLVFTAGLLNIFSSGSEKEMANEMTVFTRINFGVIKRCGVVVSQTA